VKRTLEVVSQGRLHAVECLVSLAGTQAVYALIRTLRPAIYGKVRAEVVLEGWVGRRGRRWAWRQEERRCRE